MYDSEIVLPEHLRVTLPTHLDNILTALAMIAGSRLEMVVIVRVPGFFSFLANKLASPHMAARAPAAMIIERILHFFPHAPVLRVAHFPPTTAAPCKSLSDLSEIATAFPVSAPAIPSTPTPTSLTNNKGSTNTNHSNDDGTHHHHHDHTITRTIGTSADGTIHDHTRPPPPAKPSADANDDDNDDDDDDDDEIMPLRSSSKPPAPVSSSPRLVRRASIAPSTLFVPTLTDLELGSDNPGGVAAAQHSLADLLSSVLDTPVDPDILTAATSNDADPTPQGPPTVPPLLSTMDDLLALAPGRAEALQIALGGSHNVHKFILNAYSDYIAKQVRGRGGGDFVFSFPSSHISVL